MAIQNLSTEQFREIVVTDIDFLFDFGLKDSLTLYDTDVFELNPVRGTIEVILVPKFPGGFPEYITYQISKVICQRKSQRTMRVKVAPVTTPPPTPPVAATASDPALAAPESSNPSDSGSPAAVPPPGHPAYSSPVPPTPRPQTPAARPHRTRRRATPPAVDPEATTGGQRSLTDSDGTS